MNILITGGFGFLGSRLAEYFLAKGHNIALASRLQRDLIPALKGAQSLRVDWDDETCLKRITKNQDIIIHAAGMNSHDSILDPEGAHIFNGSNTQKFAKISEQSGVKKFIFLSTVHVYASPLLGSITEESPTTNTHPYALSHLAGEKFINFLEPSTNMQGIILRLSNNFGYPTFPNLACWSLVVNDLCLQAVANHSIVLRGDGKSLRDFLPISLFCHAADKIISNEPPFSNNIDTYNISSSKTISIMNIAQKIQSLCMKHFHFEPQIITNNKICEPQANKFLINSRFEILFKDSYDAMFDRELINLINFCQSNNIKQS